MEERKRNPTTTNATPRRRVICNSCRRRKSKCDGREPQCSTCLAHNSQCHYDKPPSLAYVRSLEATIEKLLQERDGSSSNIKSNQRSETLMYTVPYHVPVDDSLPDSTVATDFKNVMNKPNRPNKQLGETSREEPGPNEHWASEISVNSRGGVSYHGPTSSFHQTPVKDGIPSATGSSSDKPYVIGGGDTLYDADQIRHSLVSNAAAQRHLEMMAVERSVSIHDDVSIEMAGDLLKYYWCWIHPTFQFVYRPAFTRDMALSSTGSEKPYFSQTLLKVLLGHSSRFRTEKGTSSKAFMENLAQQGRIAIGTAISETSSIDIVQALLQQSGREAAFANSSQAWLYSGMAFRMAIDLGIHLPNDKLRRHVNGLDAEDIEIRKRLFWSCFTWDKAISLYCGRMPAFTPPIDGNIPEFLDDFTENELWAPYYGEENDQQDTSRTPYQPQKGYMVSCFTGLCKLCVILGEIMLEIYGNSPDSQDSGAMSKGNTKNQAFIRISSSLQSWWTELPDTIRLNIKILPLLCPPLHIVTLNLLYHTTLILLYRPFIMGATEFRNPAVSRSYRICVTATAAIHDLLQLLTFTFGYSHTTYMNCYSTYIGATIAILQFQLQDEIVQLPTMDVPPEKMDLKFFLDILQRSATNMPGLNRSVDIVKRHMQTILERRSKRYMDSLFPIHEEIDAQISLPQPRDQASVLAEEPKTDQHQKEQTNENFQPYSGFNLEGLPAFPGQNFNVGMDFALDPEITDPEIRAALLGLDPHLTLHHENSDWAYGDFFMGDQIH